MKILVINSGSSSIKYQLFDMPGRIVLAVGLLEQIGGAESRLTHQTCQIDGSMAEIVRVSHVSGHKEGLQLISSVLQESGSVNDMNELDGIGHRVVHGGESFRAPTIIDQTMVDAIRKLIPLAPLHNPANLTGIEVSLESAPDVPQVAVFDTAFHQTIPAHAFRYAIPEEMYQKNRVRRYGFHGTSHHCVAKKAALYLGRPLQSLCLITLHLGNGASAAAIKHGCCVDTSMGLTPLEGLIMGTRSGDIDPAIIFYLARQTGLSSDEIDAILNLESGLKGICGINDMREIGNMAEAGDPRAKLAVEMTCYRIKKYIGAYYAALGCLDAVIFTGGIGENAGFIRSGSCENLMHLGIGVDAKKNSRRSAGVFEIQTAESCVKVLVVPTNEELEIAEQTVAVVEATLSLSAGEKT